MQPPLRILGYDEYRTLVEQVTAGDPVTGAYTVFLGETGTRKQANPAGARPQKRACHAGGREFESRRPRQTQHPLGAWFAYRSIQTYWRRIRDANNTNNLLH